MTQVVADISMSLDGFVTGPDPDLEHGLGRGGEPLHTWAVDSSDDTDTEVLREATQATGAVVMGRRLFDFVDGPHGWSDDIGYSAGIAGTPPFVGGDRRQLVQRPVRVSPAATHLTYD